MFNMEFLTLVIVTFALLHDFFFGGGGGLNIKKAHVVVINFCFHNGKLNLSIMVNYLPDLLNL